MGNNMKEYLKRNSLKVSSGVANAVFVTVGVGYLLEIIGDMLGLQMLVLVGQVAKVLLAPALGAGIAVMMQANTLTIFSAMAASTLGGGAIQIAEGGMTIIGGEPIGALLAGTIATWVGKKVTGKTPFDMMAIPVSALVVGGVAGVALSQVMTPLLTTISAAISSAVSGNPVVGSAVLAVVFGLLLMSPASSAALSVALALDPMSNGAMLIGTTAQYFAFSILSMRENDLGGYIAQGLCTPKVQLPNIIKNPAILIGPTLSSAICGPLATVVFGFETIPAMGGMGFAAMVAPLYVFNNNPLATFGIYLFCGAVLPIAITYGVNKVLYTRKKIKAGDMALTVS
ncbi:PTS transporter subunit IIC [Atopococcus tabaci]|uniref:PTS transporter subunit IIC n=1 Tax=Atopococcus tabaci TaxID=269774 RepID=UPI0024097193|nr:PTS sugar transporter subunit IIC [Atopococcus tabaci]